MPQKCGWTKRALCLVKLVKEKEKDKYYMVISVVCGVKKIKHMYIQNRNRLRDIEDKLMFTKGGRNKLTVRD